MNGNDLVIVRISEISGFVAKDSHKKSQYVIHGFCIKKMELFKYRYIRI